ncbi:PhoH family protein [Halorhodospira halochloris]|uniref:PhoH family protein n=1 Tax=Halorhodospira halochloris TaxID=1052 RepID=UPI001EE79C6F|nr:PhoH family protein [Halorhodospira halochloris]MCG5529516.1 PhoH family protein [Halorhodospira halochloris]
MNTRPGAIDLELEPADNERLARLCGQFDENIRQLERRLGVEIKNQGHRFRVIGSERSVDVASQIIEELYSAAAHQHLAPENVHLHLQQARIDEIADGGRQAGNLEPDDSEKDDQAAIRTRKVRVSGRGPGQRAYLERIRKHDLSFGIGPAGTGKTYLAVACAVEALESEAVRRVVLVRPAVEAGERLGFLPGDMAQKVDPYLRPLYDALFEMLGFERVGRLIERNVIEVAPLAFMRGRTLNHSFIILDEAQNSTVEQMKMFLTRIGFGSTAVVTGDVTQIDLPPDKQSGLRDAIDVLHNVEGVSFTFFSATDVVRHSLVQRIVEAYDSQSRLEQGGSPHSSATGDKRNWAR